MNAEDCYDQTVKTIERQMETFEEEQLEHIGIRIRIQMNSGKFETNYCIPNRSYKFSQVFQNISYKLRERGFKTDLIVGQEEIELNICWDKYVKEYCRSKIKVKFGE